MLWARRRRVKDKSQEVVVSTASDKTAMESLVAAQYSLKNVDELVKKTNITILKIQSILVSRAPKVLCLITSNYPALSTCFGLKKLLHWTLAAFNPGDVGNDWSCGAVDSDPFQVRDNEPYCVLVHG